MTRYSPEAVTKLALDLLSKNKGLFIGEQHDTPFAEQFVSNRFEEFKKAGVTTLYVEYNMYKARASQGGNECRETFMGPSDNPQDKGVVSNFQLVIEAATRAGLRVIGHDSLNGTSWQFNRKDKDPKLAEDISLGGPAMDRRDDFAVQVIQRTQDGGKYIIYGGLGHSGNETPDRPSGKGLSERLGIPSIDFHSAGGFLARENVLTKGMVIAKTLKAAMADEVYPIEVLPGKNGESTYKVLSGDDFAFAKKMTLADTLKPPSPAEAAKLDAAFRLAQQIKDAGQCNAPAHLNGKEYLDTSDIENLAKGMKKPPAANKAQSL